MMPGVGFEEMILLVVVAIIVIGPKDLPLMMRKFGKFTGKMRAMAFEFKQGIDELGRQAELEELRKEVANLKASTGLDDLKRDIEQDRFDLEKDVNASLAPPTPTHPAAASAAVLANGAAETAAIPNYAGLSADHPGYDTGDDFRIDGGMPDSANGPSPEHVNGVHVNGEAADAPHIIPDDDVALAAPAPVKQDSPA